MISSNKLKRKTYTFYIGAITFFIANLGINVTAKAEEHSAFLPVKQLFAAMSAFDHQAMQATGTDDFQLLEHGEVWSMQRLYDAIVSQGKNYQRRNFFNVIKTQVNGTSVWISYWNKAEITGENRNGIRVWLESAVMTQQDGRWKIQMLHSTRVNDERVPKDIEWLEFKG